MDAGHDALTGRAVEDGALATHGLADECLLADRRRPTPQHGGWNCTNSMSRAGSPARSASASPSPVTAGGFDVGKGLPVPLVAITIARAVTTPTDSRVASFTVGERDLNPGHLSHPRGVAAHHEVERKRMREHVDTSGDGRLVETIRN